MNLYGGLSIDASRLFRVRKTTIKMLSNRGYIVSQHELDMTSSEFKNKVHPIQTSSQSPMWI